jgi:uncharacterized iron-regulated membrane protein
MQTIRRYHLYAGMFFAPAIFMFALSGALQTFRLQEEKGWGGTPPALFVLLASIHKDSRLPKAQAAPDGDHHHDGDEADHHDGDAAKPAAAAAPMPPKKPPQAGFTLPMKIFALLMSVGLMLSALLGVVIALNTRAVRRVSIAMLVAGAVLPLVLLML